MSEQKKREMSEKEWKKALTGKGRNGVAVGKSKMKMEREGRGGTRKWVNGEGN